MSIFKGTQDEITPNENERYMDPVSYLAGLGIDAELVGLESRVEERLEEAA